MKAKLEFEEKGERHVKTIRETVTSELQKNPKVCIDYISVAEGHSSEELADDDELCATSSTLLSVAVTIGETRLIDNVVL